MSLETYGRLGKRRSLCAILMALFDGCFAFAFTVYAFLEAIPCFDSMHMASTTWFILVIFPLGSGSSVWCPLF